LEPKDPFSDPEIGATVLELQSKMFEARVVERINRFLVKVSTPGDEILCHLHDPGRLKELIFRGNAVLIRESQGNKTHYSITAASQDGEWVLTDTRFHSSIAKKFLPENALQEVRVGKHRLDFLSGQTYIEVKGCTLMVDHVAMFPDAPTARGVEHLKLLRNLVNSGYGAELIVLVLRTGARCFLPNKETDPGFHSEFIEVPGFWSHCPYAVIRV
jgi:sugar fermentation stimulation protein